MRFRFLLLSVFAALPLACGSSDSGGPVPEVDSGSDAVDSAVDSRVDTSKDDTTIDDTAVDSSKPDVAPESSADVSDSSETASDSTTEIGTDGSSDGEAGPSADVVTCGTVSCDTTVQMCCIDTGVTPFTATCTALTASCSDLELDCDGAEDCGGEICCGSDGGGSYCDTVCATGDRPMCHFPTDCASGETCTSCSLGATSYGVCLPSSATCPW